MLRRRHRDDGRVVRLHAPRRSLLAIIFVYLILAAQFESFIDPLVDHAVAAAVDRRHGRHAALTGDTLNIMSLIGLIMLMGLVTKNAILLVDFTNGAARRAACDRARGADHGRAGPGCGPIVMTTLAMIFGMLPLSFALGEGAEFRAPMARAVVGGLITSTLLTLIVVPVVYTLLDDVAAWLFGGRSPWPPCAHGGHVGGTAGRPSAQPAPAHGRTRASAVAPALAPIAGAAGRAGRADRRAGRREGG
ncbi:MAG: efflux RND transporter permease subunit [Comamonadaceae bacterium]|nr:efflux RND transporter permease subunit [Comamonadaceae bacterium]